MSVTRRDFIKAGAAAASLAALPRTLRAAARGAAGERAAGIDDPARRELAMRTLDAARGSGAAYADVRLTHEWRRIFSPTDFGDAESMEVGVRALVRGYWGFASGPVWSPDEMARLGREAVHQARTNALGKTRVVELAATPSIAGGRWATPVVIDPFVISPYEIVDYLRSLEIFTSHIRRGATLDRNGCMFTIQEKAFASTDGSYCTQRLYFGAGDLMIELDKDGRREHRAIDGLSVSGLGWELYHGQPIREAIRRAIEEMEADLKLPVKPVDVGRFDAILDADSVATLLDATIARATELDRALGYEANAGGTSYLDAPLEMLGSYHAGAPLMTVTGDRSAPGGAATVQWDDEGVAPDEFTLVHDGVLADFQTTRESAIWLAPYYAKRGRAVRSHGCANADSAIDAPLQQPPNITLRPGSRDADVDALTAAIDDGIAIDDLDVDMDFQYLNGLGQGRIYRVKKGKRVSRIASGGVLFRAPELWKGLHALGGPASARRFGSWTRKGEPAQATCHSVTAVPAVFKQLTLIDPRRKA